MFLFFFISIFACCFGQNPNVITWKTTITNPVLNHRIPLLVHFPNASTSPWPLMVFNHGGDTKNTWYDFVWKNLVPQGYIVVMPGDYEKYINDLHYAADQRYTLDFMLADCNVNASGSCPLLHKISNISIASGHSMGGGASFFSIGNYPLNQTFLYEFNASFTLSGCAFSDKMEDAVKNISNKNVFIMSATHDCICPPSYNSVIFYEEIADENTCKFLADITNGTHCHFMEPPFEVRDVPCLTEEKILCPREYHNNIPQEKQWSIVNKYMTLFLNATLYQNYDNFQLIIDELNNDKAAGIMADIGNANCPTL